MENLEQALKELTQSKKKSVLEELEEHYNNRIDEINKIIEEKGEIKESLEYCFKEFVSLPQEYILGFCSDSYLKIWIKKNKVGNEEFFYLKDNEENVQEIILRLNEDEKTDKTLCSYKNDTFTLNMKNWNEDDDIVEFFHEILNKNKTYNIDLTEFLPKEIDENMSIESLENMKKEYSKIVEKIKELGKKSDMEVIFKELKNVPISKILSTSESCNFQLRLYISDKLFIYTRSDYDYSIKKDNLIISYEYNAGKYKITDNLIEESKKMLKEFFKKKIKEYTFWIGKKKINEGVQHPIDKFMK